MHGRRLKKRLLNRYCIVGMSESVTRQSVLKSLTPKKTHMDWPDYGTELYTFRREYKGPDMARAGFAESFDRLRKVLVFSREIPVEPLLLW